MTSWLWILLGLVVLTVGAELLVRGAAWIAEVLGVRHMVVGLTVVAIGTSAPELVVSLIAALNGNTGLPLGTVYGSNIANIALIMGVTALVTPIVIKGGKVRFEMFWVLGATFVTIVPFFTGEYGIALGGMMILALAVFLYAIVNRERKSRPSREKKAPSDRGSGQVAIHVAMVLAGLVGLVFGGDWLVGGAVEVAKALEISDATIGATIVAIGTSLPELATSIVAARKGHAELALGNIIGSNIFNILMVLGVTAIAVPLPVTWAEHGMRTVFGLGLTVFMACLLLGPKRLSRPVGAVLLLSYITYIVLEAV
jgi:cation:H+ antiporter